MKLFLHYGKFILINWHFFQLIQILFKEFLTKSIEYIVVTLSLLFQGFDVSEVTSAKKNKKITSEILFDGLKQRNAPPRPF